ncbi:helix-turn-helix domain-containing protein [Alteribacillus sp. YIM 98480]|uniref:response regulator transcription factor n=1 Tax=Alteribacillus sp. YIM 98480 TaxID=2606599 RepID=UPI00131E34E0|nr:helix-turn-helix domain-containing protein [Alteribacillus sp. YIM 98480]
MSELLIIDDDIENCQKIRSIVENSPYRDLLIYEAETAKEGLTILKKKKPFIIILDLSLPDGDGIDTGKEILALYPYISIVVTTHLKMFQPVYDSINAGFSAFHLKPLAKSELLETFDRLFAADMLNDSKQLLEFQGNTSSFETDFASPIQTAIDYVQLNYHKPITLQEVSDMVYLSPSHFSRMFKDETKTTFIEYLTEIRIEKSKHFLKMTSLPIEVIAHNIGFSSAGYFSTTFKRLEGKTPREYRNIFINFIEKPYTNSAGVSKGL